MSRLVLNFTAHTLEDLNKNGIYAIVNKITSKFYLGSAASVDDCLCKTGFYYRWVKHLSDLKNNQHHCLHLQRAWNKYGQENFDFKILEFCESDKCIEVEQMYLDLFPEGDRENVYNICFTAGSTKGRKHSQETLKKISEQNKGKNAKEFYLVSPEGEEFLDKNLDNFSRSIGFDSTGLHQVVSNKILHFKGWTNSIENHKYYLELYKFRGILKEKNRFKVTWKDKTLNKSVSKYFQTLEEATLFRDTMHIEGYNFVVIPKDLSKLKPHKKEN